MQLVQNSRTKTQKQTSYHTTAAAHYKGEKNTPPPALTASHKNEMPLRDKDMNELCIPQSSNVLLVQKIETLYVPPDFNNHLAVDAINDSTTDSIANLETELDRIKK